MVEETNERSLITVKSNLQNLLTPIALVIFAFSRNATEFNQIM